jgi:hypothetical protein
MAKITVTVCDECGVQSGVRQYEVREGTRKVTLDLCEAHCAPLEQFLGDPTKGSPKSLKQRQARPRTRRVVTSLEEIEQLKNR